jgi:hypothetical protein
VSNHFPITPPPKLVGEWLTEAADLHLLTPSNLDYLATRAARWGADMELEAVEEEIIAQGWFTNSEHFRAQLRAARRPKPPSLKEQAIAALNEIEDHMLGPTNQEKLIRRALEALDD